MPKWEEPVIEEPKKESPVWNVPIPSESKEEDKIVSAVPLWEDIKPKLEDNTPKDLDTNINIFDTSGSTNSDSSNNSFWIPVSDEKMETSSFPNINIPINDGLSSNDNFGFPELNNN